MCGNWSLPTGTRLALQKRMSAAWCTGKVSIRPVIGRPEPSSSSFTVGLRRSSESLTSERNGRSSWLSAGTEEWVKMVVLAGSMPIAR